MVNDTTARMWGIFDETGMFACICHYGFILCVADMVRSGELAKYPLAVVEHLLKTLGEGIGAGYDVGCHFDITLSRTPLAQLAHQSAFVSLVNIFHGHGHNRKCQVKRLPTYVDGMGLEDLEGCERLFAKMNELAGGFRHSSAFHQRQSLALYFQHLDEVDTKEALSEFSLHNLTYWELNSTGTFLVNNYKQALGILANAPMGYSEFPIGTDFQQWLDEEYQYLESKRGTPPDEEFKIEYYQELVALNDIRCVFLISYALFAECSPFAIGKSLPNWLYPFFKKAFFPVVTTQMK